MSSKRDYYQVLGVDKGTEKSAIKKAYRKLAMKYHPDRNPGDQEAEQKFKEASEAAEVLLDDQKRSRYDQFGHAGVEGQTHNWGAGGFSGDSFSDLGDVFGDIFGDFFGGGGRGGRSRSRARGGNDLQLELELDFEEAVFGVEKVVSINRHVHCNSCDGQGGKWASCNQCQGVGEVRRQQGFFTIASACPACNGLGEKVTDPCKTCHGEGRTRKKMDLEIKIPAGIDEGQRLKLSREGDAGPYNGPAGDLYVFIKIKNHKIFTREGTDLYCQVPITFSQAALGHDIHVPTIKGKVEVTIPPGTQSGKKMRLKGKGVPDLRGNFLGDQILEIHVETPQDLTGEQKEIFDRLAQLEKSNKNHPMGHSFLDKLKDFFL